MSKATSSTRFSPRTLLILSAVASLVLIASGLVYYSIEQKRIFHQEYIGIASVANLKVRDIERWRLERLADARELARSPLLDRAIFKWLRSSNDARVLGEIRKQLQLERKLSLYKNAFVADTTGRTIIAGGRNIPEIGSAERSYFEETLKTREPVLGDIFHGSDGREYIDVMDAVINKARKPVAVVVLRSDVANFIFPLLNSWPVANRTAETVLVERRGNNVVTLNPFRSGHHKSETVVIPLGRTDAPAVQAVLGKVGMFEGRDYRGKSVLADIRAIPGTPWFLIARVDTQELFKEIRYRVGTVGLLIALIILFLTGATAYAYRDRQAEVYRELYEREAELREIHEEYRATVYSIGDGVITTDIHGSVKQMNPVAEKLTGWKESDAKGKALEEVFKTLGEETGKAQQSELERVFREGVVVGSAEPTILVSKDGVKYPISYTVAPIHDDKSRNVGLVMVFQDESAGREAARKLKESEGNYRNLVQMSPDAIVIYQDGKVVFINEPGAKLAGARTTEELIGKPITDFMNPDSLKESRAREERMLRGEKVQYPVEDKYLKLDGTEVPVEISAGPTFFGGKAAMQVVIRDVTERVRRERELHESEERFRTLFENSTIGLYRTTPGGKIILSNPALVQMLGYSSFDELASRNLEDEGFEPNYSRREFVDRIEKDGEVIGLESSWTRKDGSVIYVRENARAMGDSSGKTVYYDGTVEDITEHRKAEHALRESEEKFRALVEGSASAIWIHNGDHLLYANPTAIRLTGYTLDELTKIDIMEIHLPEERALLREQIMKRLGGEDVVNHFESRILRKNGDTVWADFTASLIEYRDGPAIIVSAYDINERKKLEEQLIQSQKMEGLGRLAGGVAHDFNNMLGVIIGYAQLLLKKVPKDSPEYRYVELIDSASNRGADLTKQLLAFARKEMVTPKTIDPNETIKSLHKMLVKLIGEDITLKFEPGADIWNIKMDETQFGQIVINLVTNSRDAIKGMGTIAIETSNAYMTERSVKDRLDMTPGEYFVMNVSDDGVGMDKETMGKIFEPFFTTKAKGQGTGLGLSTVYGIVRQNGGSISVYSEVGIGTTLKIYLPRHSGTLDKTKTEERTADVNGSETVLVVEDQAQLLEMAKNVLEGYGYKVLTAQKPGEAILLCMASRGEIHVLLTDVIMPEMNGKELRAKIETIIPGIKTVFMSGYTADIIGERGMLEKDIEFIQKPFTPYSLAGKIRKVLS